MKKGKFGWLLAMSKQITALVLELVSAKVIAATSPELWERIEPNSLTIMAMVFALIALWDTGGLMVANATESSRFSWLVAGWKQFRVIAIEGVTIFYLMRYDPSAWESVQPMVLQIVGLVGVAIGAGDGVQFKTAEANE